MGALRRAGVWLGLIEDEQDRDSFYEDEFVDDEEFALPTRKRQAPRPTQRRGDRDYTDRSVGGRDAGRESTDDRFERELRVVRDRSARDPRTDHRTDHRADYDDRPSPLRLAEPREPIRERSERPEEPTTVRSLHRPTAGSTALSVPAPESLTMAPPVQLRERAAVTDDRVTRRYEISTLHPTSYSEARAIGEQFRDGHPVIMNLTDLPEADAKRLVDFAAGLAFGLRGSIERVTNRVFLLTPPNIRVSDEDKQRIAEPGFFDQR
jgi:cell division inhibitor SepF